MRGNLNQINRIDKKDREGMASVLWQSFLLMLSLFTILPIRQNRYKQEYLRYCLAFFPLAGILTAALLYLPVLVLPNSVPKYLLALLMLLCAIISSGGIHVDGFADSADAFASHQTAEKMLEIMKDHHIGSFGVMYLIGAFSTAYISLCALMSKGQKYDLMMLLLLPCFGRALSGLFSSILKSARHSGMQHAMSNEADDAITAKRFVTALLSLFLLIFLALILVLSICSHEYKGLYVAGGTLIYAFLFGLSCRRKFGGATGDLAGFLLVSAEGLYLLLLAVI